MDPHTRGLGQAPLTRFRRAGGRCRQASAAAHPGCSRQPSAWPHATTHLGMTLPAIPTAACASSSPGGWTGRQAELRAQHFLQTPPQVRPGCTRRRRGNRPSGQHSAAQLCPAASAAASGGLHLSRATHRTVQRGTECGGALGAGMAGGLCTGAWTGASASRLGGPSTASCVSGRSYSGQAGARGLSTSAHTPAAVPATLTPIVVTCPLAAAVVTWVPAT